eukprot:1696033-Pyramimonas_sp.AAC.2
MELGGLGGGCQRPVEDGRGRRERHCPDGFSRFLRWVFEIFDGSQLSLRWVLEVNEMSHYVLEVLDGFLDFLEIREIRGTGP